MASEFGFGTLISNLSNKTGTGYDVRQQERGEQHDDYIKREREGIQARVEGAKAAGIHPLVAMGFQGAPGPSSVIGGVREASNVGLEHLGSSSPSTPQDSSALSEDQERINKARVRQEEANADLAEITAHNAYRNLANQPGQGIPVLTDQQPMPTSPRNLRSGIKLTPDEVTASRSSAGLGSALTAGVHPGGTDFTVPIGKYGRSIRLPSGKLAESLEDLDALKLLLSGSP